MDPLQSKFIAFAVFGKGPAAADQAVAKPKAVVMDSKGFAKLCKESKIMSGRLDLTRVDLCFTKCCDKARASSLQPVGFCLMRRQTSFIRLPGPLPVAASCVAVVTASSAPSLHM